MSRDCMISSDDKRNIAAMIDKGYGNKTLSKIYGVNKTSASKWIYVYKAFGMDGLLNMGSARKTYDYETKLAAAQAHVDEGKSIQEVMAEFGIKSMSRLQQWCKAYNAGDLESLKPKPKGRPKGSVKKPKKTETELERLRAENERLRCELEVEKRLNALADAKRQGVRKLK